MSRINIATILALFASGVMAAPGNEAHLYMNYDHAIAETVALSGDFGVNLNRCVRNWDIATDTRATLPDVTARNQGAVLLEAGSGVGWPHYSYIRIDGMSLSSSSGATMDLSQTALGEWLRELYTNIPPDLTGIAVDDEFRIHDSCYFLTLSSGTTRKSFAVYGHPDTLIGTLLAEMITTAAGDNGSDAHCRHGWCREAEREQRALEVIERALGRGQDLRVPALVD